MNFIHSMATLPPVAEPNFTWGAKDAASFCDDLNTAYKEVSQWQRNLFDTPRGSAGKAFVYELARLFRAVGQGTALESIALKAVFVASSLLLQRTCPCAKPTDNAKRLGERLILRKNGEISELLHKGRTIQARFKSKHVARKNDQSSRVFAKLMFEGRTKVALQLLAGKHNGGVLNLDDKVDSGPHAHSVRDVLKSKHPPAQPLHLNCLLPNWGNPPVSHPVVFNALDGCVIRSAALRTTGAAGPSGMDARCWRRLCTAFHSASSELCIAIALFARRICSSFVSPDILAPFVACRLIALDKQPGVRPFGECEVVRRLVAKAVLSIIREDIMMAAGPLQLCGGQMAGVEAAIHSVRELLSVRTVMPS